MTQISSRAPIVKPSPLDAAALRPTPAPQLSSRRNSGARVGSRAPSAALASTGDEVPATPPMPKFTPFTSATSTSVAPAKAEQGAAPNETPAAVSTNAKIASSPAPQSRASSTSGTPKAMTKTSNGINQVSLKPKAAAASGTSTPRARSSSQQSSEGASPAASRSAAGFKSTSRYIQPRASLRPVSGKSNSVTDVFALHPPAEAEIKSMNSVTRISKRAASAAYAPTSVIYTDEESKQFQSEQRHGGKRHTNTYDGEAPWEHNKYVPPSPKRAGSAKPQVLTATTAPWTKEDPGSVQHSCRSHSAVVRTTEAPFGVSLDQPSNAFKRGETKIVQHPRPVTGRPTTGRSCSRVPRDHDVLNPDANLEKPAPSGRRPPPASALEPSPEAVHHSTKRHVDIPEKPERGHGKKTKPTATSLSPTSPFRADRNVSFEPTSPRSSKVLVKGFSGGAQSMHLDPTNTASITSLHTPHRQRIPPTNRGRSNIESTPGTDRDSKQTVDLVRASRNKSTLVGVLSPAPAIHVAPYAVTPPFWTADAN